MFPCPTLFLPNGASQQEGKYKKKTFLLERQLPEDCQFFCYTQGFESKLISFPILSSTRQTLGPC